MKVLFLLLFYLSVLSAVPLPQSQFILDKRGFIIGYDGRTRNASWVYEKLSRESLKERAVARFRYRFTQDSTIPDPFRAKNKDYRNSGFDRGHLCPFADLSDSCAEESFLLSNVCPQSPAVNHGIWRQLEKHIRSLTLEYNELHVITLPLYLPEIGVDGKRYVHYQVLGETGVAVPTHLAKAIFAQKEDRIEVFVYLLPNKIIEESSLDSFKIPLEHLERLSGILFPSLESFRYNP